MDSFRYDGNGYNMIRKAEFNPFRKKTSLSQSDGEVFVSSNCTSDLNMFV